VTSATRDELIVLFDGGCPLCRRTVRLVRRLDWLHRLRFIDATDPAAREAVAPGLSEAAIMIEMYVVDRRGALYPGYDGYFEMARVVPMLWPLRLLGRLPGVRPLAQFLYRIVAANRTRRGRCTDELCDPLPARK
jgi:predicted DCC family thiol-disulfide oxidoreductase YuxK